MQAVSFVTLSDLEQFLNKHEIDQKSWTKRRADLFQETQTNDCSIWINAAGTIERRVRPAFITVVAKDAAGASWKLREVKQIFRDKDGNVTNERSRNNDFVGEKLSPTESPIEGAKRGLKEELQVDTKNDELTLDKEETSERASDSYPNIKSIYHIFRLTYRCPTAIYESHKDGFTEIETKRDGATQETRFEWIKIADS